MEKIEGLSDDKFLEAKKLNEVIRNLNELQERVEVLRKSAVYSLAGLKSLIGMGKSEECGEMVNKIEKILGELDVKVE